MRSPPRVPRFLLHSSTTVVLYLFTVLLVSLRSHAQTSPPHGIPNVIHEHESTVYGTWTWHSGGPNGYYNATWQEALGPAIATITIESFTAKSVVLDRTDTAASVSAGLTAVYTGQISSAGDSIVNGRVTWTWPGHAGYPTTGVWTASWAAPQSAQILLDGTDTDITGTTQEVLIGQRIALTSILPDGATRSGDDFWSLDGQTVGGFSVSPSYDDPEQGKSVTTNRSQSAIQFYWLKPGTFKVTLVYSLVGVTQTISATFVVKGPSLSDVSVVTTFGHVDITHHAIKRNGRVIGIDTDLQLGVSLDNPGVTLERFSSENSGTFEWLQLLGGTLITKRIDGRTSERCFISDGLDNLDPFPAYSSTEARDAPSATLPSSPGTTFSENMIARMYVLWNPTLPDGCTLPEADNGAVNPCTSISVPIGFVRWGWSGIARNDRDGHNWRVIDGSTFPNQPILQTSEEMPFWNKVIKNGKTNKCEQLESF
jgi:hypothetical protein